MSQDKVDYEERVEEAHGKPLSTSVLMVYVDSCRHLPLSKTGVSSKPDPIVQMRITSRIDSQETWSVKYSRNPVYEQGFIFLVNNPEVDELNLRVYDEKTKADLGLLRLALINLLNREGMEYFNQPFKLKRTGLESTITLHLQLFFTKKVLRPIRPSKRRISLQSREIDIMEDSVSLGGGEDSDVELEGGGASNQRLQKLSVISGGSVESLAQPELKQRRMGENRIDLEAEETLTGPSILISLVYNDSEELLTLTIHRAINLPVENVADLPDPFVRIILLPDRPRKRKTDYVKDTTSPEWEESFDYSISRDCIMDKEIEIIVVDRKGIFSRSADICHVILPMWVYCDPTGRTTLKWVSLDAPTTPKHDLGNFLSL